MLLLSLSLSLFLSAHFLRVFGAGVVANIFGDGRGDWSRLNHRAPFEKYRETVVCSFVSVLNGCETAPSCSEAAHSLSHTHTHTHTHIYTHLHLHTFSLILFVINGWNRRSYLWCLSSLVFDNRRGDGQDERLRLLRAAYGKLEDAGWFPNRSVKWRRQLLFEWSGSMRAQARSFLLTAAQVLVKSAAETWRADILIGYNWNVGEERVNWDQIGGQWSNRTP